MAMITYQFVTYMIWSSLLVFFVQLPLGTSSGMACYKCDSHNYSDPNCDDPIHPAYMKLEDNCQVPKQNHIGTFPAAFCVKIIGEKTSGEHLVIRDFS